MVLLGHGHDEAQGAEGGDEEWRPGGLPPGFESGPPGGRGAVCFHNRHYITLRQPVKVLWAYGFAFRLGLHLW